jgi:hypothetical protein
MKCKRHPEIETALSCGKCGDPICPKCMVYTPVGARCPSCARLSRVPTYQVPKIFFLRAIGSALGLAIVTGFIWGFVRTIIPFFYLDLLIAGAVGYAIGEGISFSVNRKAGTGLAIIGGLAVVSSYFISNFTFWGGFFQLFDIIAIVIGIFTAVARLR